MQFGWKVQVLSQNQNIEFAFLLFALGIYTAQKRKTNKQKNLLKKKRYADVSSVSRIILPSSQSSQTVVLLSLPTKHYIGSTVSVSQLLNLIRHT